MLQVKTSLALLPFVLQSFMVFIPMLLMAVYFIWSTCEERLKRLATRFMRKARYELIESVDTDDLQPDRST